MKKNFDSLRRFAIISHMKKEIVAVIPKANFEWVERLPDHDRHGIYVAVYVGRFNPTPDVSILRYEVGDEVTNAGYIFRSILGEAGHSGFHSTVKLACQHAMSVGTTRIYRFDNFREVVESGLLN